MIGPRKKPDGQTVDLETYQDSERPVEEPLRAVGEYGRLSYGRDGEG